MRTGLCQRNALRTWEERRPFIDVLREDPEITKVLTDEQLDACFDLERAISNVGRTFEIARPTDRRHASR